VQLAKNWHSQPARGHLRHEGPWLRASTEERFDGAKGEGGGTRGLIVRSWHARLGGVKAAPRLAAYLTEDGPRHFRTALELATLIREARLGETRLVHRGDGTINPYGGYEEPSGQSTS
jgi:hypothetical protein